MDEKKQRDWKDKPYTVDERYLFHEFSEDISEDFRTKKGLFKVLWHCKDKAQEMLLKKAKLVEQVLPDLPEHPPGEGVDDDDEEEEEEEEEEELSPSCSSKYHTNFSAPPSSFG